MNHNRIQFAEAERILQQLKDLKQESDPIYIKDTSFELLDQYAIIRRQLEKTSQYRSQIKKLNAEIKQEKNLIEIVIENRLKSLQNTQNTQNIQLAVQKSSVRTSSFPSDKTGQTYNSAEQRKNYEIEEHKSQEQLNNLFSLQEELREYSMVESMQRSQDSNIKEKFLFQEVEVKQSKSSIIFIIVIILIVLAIIIMLFVLFTELYII